MEEAIQHIQQFINNTTNQAWSKQLGAGDGARIKFSGNSKNEKVEL